MGRRVGGVVMVDGGWPCYYVTCSLRWYIPVPLALSFSPLVLQNTTSRLLVKDEQQAALVQLPADANHK